MIKMAFSNNDFVSFLGQVVSAEILMASENGCPIEVHKIPIEMYDKDCEGNKFMPFHRAHYDSKTGQSPNSPREQVLIFLPPLLNFIILMFYF